VCSGRTTRSTCRRGDARACGVAQIRMATSFRCSPPRLTADNGAGTDTADACRSAGRLQPGNELRPQATPVTNTGIGPCWRWPIGRTRWIGVRRRRRRGTVVPSFCRAIVGPACLDPIPGHLPGPVNPVTSDPVVRSTGEAPVSDGRVERHGFTVADQLPVSGGERRHDFLATSAATQVRCGRVGQ